MQHNDVPNRMNNLSREQFTYGKREQFSPNKVMDVSAGLRGCEEALTKIVKAHIFWPSSLKSGTEKREAVGSFFLHNNYFEVGDESTPQWDQFLFLVKGVIERSNNSSKNYVQYHYVLIPKRDVEGANLPNGIFDLLLWFSNTSFPMGSNKLLGNLTIPIIDLERSDRYEDDTLEIVEDIRKALEEENAYDNNPYVLSAISGLLNDRRILINEVSSSPISSVSMLRVVLRLLPSACRYRLPVAIGDFDSGAVGWAKILVKLSDTSSIEPTQLPQDLVWLNRSRANVIGLGNLRNVSSSQSLYLDKIRTIITQPDKDWVVSLLQDLNELKGPLWTLETLKEFPPQQKQTDSRDCVGMKLGLWGIPGAGKTTYILHLYLRMRERNSGFSISAKDDDSENFINRKQTELNELGYIQATPPGEEKTVTFEIRTEYTLTPITMLLSFIDLSGGFHFDLATFIEVEEAEKIMAGSGTSLLEHLTNCQGIIFLMPPDSPRTGAESHQVMIPNLLERLRRFSSKNKKLPDSQSRLKQFMVFCATKVDKEEFWKEAIEDQYSFVKSILGTATSSLANSCFYSDEKSKLEQSEHNRCNFFATASIGRYEDDGELREAFSYPSSGNTDTRTQGFYPGENEVQIRDTNSEDAKNDIGISGDNKEEKQSPTFFGRRATSKNEDDSEAIDSNAIMPKLKKDVTYQSVNVVEPVKWLIRKIHAYEQKGRYIVMNDKEDP